VSQTSGPTCGYRVVQVHPLLRCNLRCLHCYSTSGPQQATVLDPEELCQALNVFHAEGFNGVGISGGEPLLYPGLPHLLSHIRRLGMLATVTTNATLLDDETAAMFSGLASVVAVSLDGMPESHNRIRGSLQAFERMTAGVRRLRNCKVPFGFIFTLSLHNLQELAWIAEFAVSEGAQLLQIHPLEEVGRARGGGAGRAPDNLELARAFLEVARLQKKFKGAITLQYDVADVELLRAQPERAYADDSTGALPAPETGRAAVLGELIAPVVLEANGAVVPLQHGFSRRYQIANIKSGRLEAEMQDWKSGGYKAFRHLSNNVYQQIVNSSSEYSFVNWYGQMLETSFSLHDSNSKPENKLRDLSHAVSPSCAIAN